MKNKELTGFSLMFAIGTAAALKASFDIPAAVFVGLLILCVVIFRVFPKQAIISVAAAGIICGFVYTNMYINTVEKPAEQLAGKMKRVEITVMDYPEIYGNEQRVKAVISSSELGTPAKIHTFLYLPITDGQIEPGDKISVFAEFSSAEVSDGFDRNTYYRSIGIPILASYTKMTSVNIIKPAVHPVWFYPKYIGRVFHSNLQKIFPKRQSDFLSAILLGKRKDLSRIDYNHLVKAGLAHIAAVSGMHVGFLIAVLILIFGRKWAAYLGIPALVFYVLMVGASPSVLRASVMYAMILIAYIKRRERNSINFLFLALLLVLISNPSSLMSVSLQLSFTSTLFILLFAGRIMNELDMKSKRVPYAVRKIWSAVSASLACSVCAAMTCPILLYHFGYISVMSPISNILTFWAVSLAFPLGFVVCVVSLISLKAAAVIAIPVSWTVRFIWFVADSFSKIKGGLLYSENNISIAVFCVITAVCIAVFLSKNHKIIIASVSVLIIGMISYSVIDAVQIRNRLRVTCLYEGSAQAVVVSQGDKVVLVDCGSDSIHDCTEDIAEYLDRWNYDKIDTLILTANNKSHSGSLDKLRSRIYVSEIVSGDESISNARIISGSRFRRITDKLIVYAAETDKHLAVKIKTAQKPVWIVHSLTQNRLAKLLNGEKQECSTLICSDYMFQDDKKQKELLSLLSPDDIILESSWSDSEDAGKIPVSVVKTQITKSYP